MKKLSYLFVLTILCTVMSSAQNNAQPAVYKVPEAYRFDYKVVYEINNEKGDKPEIMSYYFTKNGDYMSMVTPEGKNEKQDFIVFTKDGMMVTFGKESVPDKPGKDRDVLKVVDMRSMYKGLGEGLTALAKALPREEKSDVEKKEKVDSKSVNLDNFVRTGKTKNVFGYTADEYSKHVSGMENGKERSGTLYVWYTKVDFDPEMMLSMGLGNLAGIHSQSYMERAHTNNILGMGIAMKDYLLTEMDFTDDAGESGTPMKIISLEKTDFTKNTAGYFVENYSGMTFSQMLQKENERK